VDPSLDQKVIRLFECSASRSVSPHFLENIWKKSPYCNGEKDGLTYSNRFQTN